MQIKSNPFPSPIFLRQMLLCASKITQICVWTTRRGLEPESLQSWLRVLREEQSTSDATRCSCLHHVLPPSSIILDTWRHVYSTVISKLDCDEISSLPLPLWPPFCRVCRELNPARSGRGPRGWRDGRLPWPRSRLWSSNAVLKDR